jgi:formylmethanofuran dehydrogenase subunit E
MEQKPISPELIKATIDFHGHSCPGLAIGIRAAELGNFLTSNSLKSV